jgi:hypothetical protein
LRGAYRRGLARILQRGLQEDACEGGKGKLAEQAIVRLRKVDAGQKLMTKSGKQAIWYRIANIIHRSNHRVILSVPTSAVRRGVIRKTVSH